MSFDPRAFVEVLRELRDHPDRAIIQALTMAAYDVAFDAAAVRHLSTLLQTEVHGVSGARSGANCGVTRPPAVPASHQMKYKEETRMS